MNYKIKALLDIPDWNSICRNLLATNVDGKPLEEYVDVDRCLLAKLPFLYSKSPQWVITDFDSEYSFERIFINLFLIRSRFPVELTEIESEIKFDSGLLYLELPTNIGFDLDNINIQSINERIPITYLKLDEFESIKIRLQFAFENLTLLNDNNHKTLELRS